MQTSPLLIILNPEEATGPRMSAFDEKEARHLRRLLGDTAHDWVGSTWVIESSSTESMASDPIYRLHIESSLKKTGFQMPRSFRAKRRTHGLGDALSNIKEHLRKFRLARKVPIKIIGGWSDEAQKLKSAIESLGYHVVLGTILTDPYQTDTEDREPVFEADVDLGNLMIVVHPGSACGSANFTLGNSQASGDRDYLAGSIAAHEGPILIVDGELSDELVRYPMLNSAITNSLIHNQQKGHTTGRVFASDDTTHNWPKVVMQKLSEFEFDKSKPVLITGIWYFEDDSAGCVNAVYDVLVANGLKARVHDSAIRDPHGDGDDEDEDEY